MVLKSELSSERVIYHLFDMYHGLQNQPEDYEQVLASLALDIQKRQTHLSEIRLRERRSTLLFSIYAIALWGGYVSLWYADWLPQLTNKHSRSQYERNARGIPVFIGPIVYVAFL